MRGELVLPYPPSVNRYWRNVRGRTLLSADGRAYRTEATLAARMARLEPFGSVAVVVSITAWMPDARRRDLDNLMKGSLDALAHAGVYDDDSQIVDLRIRKGGIDRESPRLEITLEAA